MDGHDIKKESLNEKQPNDDFGPGEDVAITLDGEIVNASGHRDQLQRGYGLLSICGLALSVDNAWVALGTSLTIAICKAA
jgi:choline transport protein